MFTLGIFLLGFCWLSSISARVCGTDAWKCENNRCISVWNRCNGRDNCGDYSDEQNCDQWSCPANMWKCSDNLCVWISDRCNGEDDCRDGGDEKGCDQWRCPGYHWKCSNHRCVWLGYRCDGQDHCGDGSDEKGCGIVHIDCPRYLMENHTHFCQCRSHNVSGSSNVTWQGQDSQTGDPGNLTLLNVQRADNGTQYTCVVNADGVREEAVYTLRVGYGPFDENMSVGPSYVVSNGSQPVTLTCNATNVNPTPDYTWRGVTCEKQSPPNTCTFTPDPASDDLRNVTCTAVSRAASWYRYFSHSSPKSASRTLKLNFLYSPGKLFQKTLNLYDRGVSFTLIAFPVPDKFVFSHHGRIVSSDKFTYECLQDTVSQRMVNCLIVPLAISEQRLGLYSLSVSNRFGSVDINFNILKGGDTSTTFWPAMWAAVGVVVVVFILITVVVIWRCWYKSQRTNAGSFEDCSSGLYEEIPELPIDQQQQLSLIPSALHVEDNPMLLQRDVVVPIHADLPPLLVPVQDRLLPEIPDAAVVVHSITPQPPSLSETPPNTLSPEMPDAGVWLPSIYSHRTPLRNPVPDTPLSVASLGARRHRDPNPPEEIEMSVLGETRSRAMDVYTQAKETLEEDYDDFYTLLGTALLYRRKDLHLRSVLGDVEKSSDENCGEEDYYLELIPDDMSNSSHSQENCQQAVYDIPRNLARPQNDDNYLHPVSDVVPNRSRTKNNDDYLHPISDVVPSLRPQNDDDYLLPASNVLPQRSEPHNDGKYLHPISDVLPNLLPKDDDDYLLPISDALSHYPRPPKGDNYLHPIYEISPKRSGSFHPKSNRSRPQRNDYLHPCSEPTKTHSICHEDYYNFPGSDNCRPSPSKTDSDKPIVFVNPEQLVFGSSCRFPTICEESTDSVSENQTQLRPDPPLDTPRVESGPTKMPRKPGDVPSDDESYMHPDLTDRTEAASRAPLSSSTGSGHPDERDDPSLLSAAHYADKPASNTLLNLPVSSESITAAVSDADQYHCPTGGRSPHGEVVMSSSIDNTDEPCVHDELHFTSFFDNPDDSSAEDEL